MKYRIVIISLSVVVLILLLYSSFMLGTVNAMRNNKSTKNMTLAGSSEPNTIPTARPTATPKPMQPTDVPNSTTNTEATQESKVVSASPTPSSPNGNPYYNEMHGSIIEESDAGCRLDGDFSIAGVPVSYDDVLRTMGSDQLYLISDGTPVDMNTVIVEDGQIVVLRSTGDEIAVTDVKPTNTIDQTQFTDVVSQYTQGEIRDCYADDYDKDGTNEAFVISVDDSEAGIWTLWFVKYSGAVKVLDHVTPFDCRTVDVGSNVLFIAEYSGHNMTSLVWTVDNKHIKELAISKRGYGLKYLEYTNQDQAELVIASKKDNQYYYLYWDDNEKELKEFGALPINKNQFLSIPNAQEAIDAMNSDDITEILAYYIRDNGTIQINGNKMGYNYTYTYSFTGGGLDIAKGAYIVQDGYEKAAFPDIATYKSFEDILDDAGVIALTPTPIPDNVKSIYDMPHYAESILGNGNLKDLVNYNLGDSVLESDKNYLKVVDNYYVLYGGVLDYSIPAYWIKNADTYNLKPR